MDIAFIQNPNDLKPYLPGLLAARALAVDLETTGLDPHTHAIRLIQLAADGIPALVLDGFIFQAAEGVSLLRKVFTTPAVKVFQNAKFDLQFLMTLGLCPKPIFDTMLAGRLLYMPGMMRRVNLETLAEVYLGEKLDKREQKGDWSAQTLTDAQIQYAAKDAEILLRLRKALKQQLLEASLGQVAEIEFSCVRAIAQMEYHGMYLDVAKWHALTDQTFAARNEAMESLYAYTGRPVAQTTLWGEDEITGLNLDSNAYVLSLLRNNGISVSATSKGDLYPYRDHPLVRALSAYRKAAKAVSSILHPVTASLHPVTGRLHPQYGQITAYSGRMSCGNPNIQQIPRDKAFRACFTAPPGRRLVIADYSQIELRVAAQISMDERMLAAYQRGEDLHALTASLLLGKTIDQISKQDRQAAKAVNFGLIYGMGAEGLRQYAGQSYGVEMTMAQAVQFRTKFFEAYRGIGLWHQKLKERPAKEGRTLCGRRFAFSGNPSLPELSNLPVQGTAADIVKKALGLLADRLEGTDTLIVGVVHDEILLECPAEQADVIAGLLKDTMEGAANSVLLQVPALVEAKVSESWAEK